MTELRLDGGRRALLHLPRGHQRPLPLVVNLHGWTSNPEEQMMLTAIAPVADREGFAVLAPQSLDASWNVSGGPGRPDDVSFIAGAIDTVAAALPIERVFTIGFSSGARMACLLAHELGDRIAGIGAVGGLRFLGPPARLVPVIAFHGDLDPVNPLAGGGPPYWQTSVEDAVTSWARHNDAGAPSTERLSETVTRTSYDGRVVLYRVAGMGHQWPGSPIDIGPPFGPPAPDLPATDLIAAFFR